MRKLVIGDLHFGIKSNSLSWLESQLALFERQIIPTIENKNIDTIIFLGDLNDIRYSINQQIGIEVIDLFRRMLDKFPNKTFVVVAGNHDYYSPLEEFSKYNFYELAFGKEFQMCHKNLKVVNKDPWMDDEGSLYLPWYWTENTDHFDEILYQYNFGKEVKSVYCHADLTVWPGARIGSLRGCPVYSGHVHNIVEDNIGNLHNLGAALALTFNDYNQDRYLYIIEDHKIVDKIKNNTTFRFKRLFNEEIFNEDDSYFDNAYVQLCVSSSNLNKAKYIDRIKYIKSKYIENANIRIHVIDSDDDLNEITLEGLNTDIKTYIDHNIPDHLHTKYDFIKSKLDK